MLLTVVKNNKSLTKVSLTVYIFDMSLRKRIKQTAVQEWRSAEPFNSVGQGNL